MIKGDKVAALEEQIHKLKALIKSQEEELKLYRGNAEEDEFIISKDQFTHIEKQLIAYQKEIKALKEENQRLMGKSKEEQGWTAKIATSELDDSTIVKLFHNTYQKITKP